MIKLAEEYDCNLGHNSVERSEFSAISRSPSSSAALVQWKTSSSFPWCPVDLHSWLRFSHRRWCSRLHHQQIVPGFHQTRAGRWSTQENSLPEFEHPSARRQCRCFSVLPLCTSLRDQAKRKIRKRLLEELKLENENNWFQKCFTKLFPRYFSLTETFDSIDLDSCQPHYWSQKKKLRPSWWTKLSHGNLNAMSRKCQACSVVGKSLRLEI